MSQLWIYWLSKDWCFILTQWIAETVRNNVMREKQGKEARPGKPVARRRGNREEIRNRNFFYGITHRSMSQLLTPIWDFSCGTTFFSHFWLMRKWRSMIPLPNTTACKWPGLPWKGTWSWPGRLWFFTATTGSKDPAWVRRARVTLIKLWPWWVTSLYGNGWWKLDVLSRDMVITVFWCWLLASCILLTSPVTENWGESIDPRNEGREQS